jgi:hypothetical protein
MCAAFSEKHMGILALGKTHRGHRSAESMEFRKAKFFCFHNSTYDPECQERIFDGTPEDLRFFIQTVSPNAYAADIPDCPRGLILADNRCQGAFQ